MSEGTEHKVNVWAVFAWLTAITVCEVGMVSLPFLHSHKQLMVFLLLGTAALKAIIVAVYFMHLKFEGKVIWTLVIGALILGAIYLSILFPDIVFSKLIL